MRLLAFALLACAAFGWGLPWLDRPGTAALGLAFLALVGGAGVTALPRRARMVVPSKTVELPDAPVAELDDLLERIAEYSGTR